MPSAKIHLCGLGDKSNRVTRERDKRDLSPGRPNVLQRMPQSCNVVFDVLRLMSSGEAVEVSVAELGHVCGLSVRQVQRAVKRLQAAHILAWRPGDGRRRLSIAEVLWDKPRKRSKPGTVSFPQKRVTPTPTVRRNAGNGDRMQDSATASRARYLCPREIELQKHHGRSEDRPSELTRWAAAKWEQALAGAVESRRRHIVEVLCGELHRVLEDGECPLELAGDAVWTLAAWLQRTDRIPFAKDWMRDAVAEVWGRVRTKSAPRLVQLLTEAEEARRSWREDPPPSWRDLAGFRGAGELQRGSSPQTCPSASERGPSEATESPPADPAVAQPLGDPEAHTPQCHT